MAHLIPADENTRVGITNSGGGIGDKLQFTSIPENYYYNTGKKLIDLMNQWCYDHNTFVERGNNTVDFAVDLYANDIFFKGPQGQPIKGQLKFEDKDFYVSQPERFKQIFGIENIYLRHPRLYKYEEMQGSRLGLVTVHTTGKSEGGTIPEKVIERIQKNYIGYTIYQVGGENDAPTPFIDKRGLDMWQTAELIASSQIFIGVNSGMMNLAQCYPRVNRKLIIIENERIETKDFDYYRPLCYYKEGVNSPWVDYNWQYYNIHEQDLGITFSYNKI